MIYQFEEFELDTDQYELRHGGSPVEMEPQVFRLLELLVVNHDRVVTKDEIYEQVWQGRFISESALSSRMTALRSAIGDDGKSQKLVKTIHGRGFRFIGAVIGDSADNRKGLQEKSGELASSSSGGAEKNPPALSIAVLPFTDMSAAKDQDYFSDGMAEEILNSLAKIQDLLVAGRTSSFSFKNKNIDIREIGKSLNVAFVLEGSVRKQRERVRITAQLIRCSDGYHQWSETYDGNLDDIFDLQDSVSLAIAGELKVILNIETGDRLASQLTKNSRAYDLYLQARSNLYGPTTEENYLSCFSCLGEAVELDPGFSAAWALLSRVHLNHSAYVWTGSARESFERARDTSRQALSIDPNSTDALAVMSQCEFADGKALAAYERAKRAFEDNPNVPALIYNWGHICCQLGYCEQAASVMERAVEIDPVYSGYWNNLAVAYQNMAEIEKSDAAAKRAVGLGDYAGYTTLAWNEKAKGNKKSAIDHLTTMFKSFGQQFGEGGDQPELWRAVAHALFNESKDDVDGVRHWLLKQFDADDFEPAGLSINGAAQFDLHEQLFAQWKPSYFAKGNLGQQLWSNFDWANNIRKHPDFQKFAVNQGWTEVWQNYVWPDNFNPDLN